MKYATPDERQPLLDLFDESETARNAVRNEVAESSTFRHRAVQGKVGHSMKLYAVPEDNPRDVVSLGTIKISDLYAWASAGVPSLISQFETLSRSAARLAELNEHDEDFEEQSIDFWAEIINLKHYLGAEANHDVAISSLLTLASTGENSFMTKEKASALSRVLNHLASKLSISSEDLLAIFEDLENADFDLAAAWVTDPFLLVVNADA